MRTNSAWKLVLFRATVLGLDTAALITKEKEQSV